MDPAGSGPPTVSVVIPSFQNVDTIAATVDTVLGQTFPDLELVISDHSSTDGTWEALQRFSADPRVRLRRQPAGGGAPANWNAVTDAARGEFVKLICGDDLLTPTAVAEQVAALRAHPEAVLAAARRDIVDDRGRVLIAGRGLQGLRAGLVPGRAVIAGTVRAGTNILGEPACVLFRRSALAAAGGWDGSWPYLIDEATYCAVLEQGPAVAIDRTLAAFRVSAGQWSVRLARQQARTVRDFHRTVAGRYRLARGEVLLGNLRATAAAAGRRLIYLALRWRRRS